MTPPANGIVGPHTPISSGEMSMTALQVYGPFGSAGLDDIVRGFFKPLRDARDSAPIKVDVVENADAFVVRAEVPGVKKEDIQVTIEGDQLTIAAEIKRESEQKD